MEHLASEWLRNAERWAQLRDRADDPDFDFAWHRREHFDGETQEPSILFGETRFHDGPHWARLLMLPAGTETTALAANAAKSVDALTELIQRFEYSSPESQVLSLLRRFDIYPSCGKENAVIDWATFLAGYVIASGENPYGRGFFSDCAEMDRNVLHPIGSVDLETNTGTVILFGGMPFFRVSELTCRWMAEQLESLETPDVCDSTPVAPVAPENNCKPLTGTSAEVQRYVFDGMNVSAAARKVAHEHGRSNWEAVRTTYYRDCENAERTKAET